MCDNFAICVKNVEKSYGSHQILNKICLNVKKGSIYGLLGSSGCGKTTILRCIIGRNKIDNGEINVLGEKQGTPLGRRLGYMPQETSLVREFTVKDSLYFFGRLYNIDDQTLKQRYKELVELLELPTDGRCIKDCSGGTQRRISFAVTLIHKPELLILDEPSVGADPILRDRFNDKALKLPKYRDKGLNIFFRDMEIFNTNKPKDNTTVIITTHYIEEARLANQVGLMREGTILLEDNPEKLLVTYNCATLEDVFLILSIKQEDSKTNIALPAIKSKNDNINFTETPEKINDSVDSLCTNYKSTDALAAKEKQKKPSTFAMYRFKALMNKNWKSLRRNTMASLFPVLMPGVQVLCFLIAVGRDTTDNPFGIVNEERSREYCRTFNINESVVPFGQWDCHFKDISCRFVDLLDVPLIDRKFYDSTEEAMKDLEKGKIRGFMYLHKNLSKLMEHRVVDGLDYHNLPDEEIQVYLDMTSLYIGGALKSKIFEIYEKFHEDVHTECNYMPNSVKLPLKMEEYFNGDKDEEFTIFMTPGIVTTMIYFMGVMMTSVIILEEKCEGIWDRSIVAGVNSLELSLSHLVFQMSFMVFMALELMAIVFIVFQQPYVGSLWLIFGIIYFQGLAGIVLGFWISIISDNYVTANVIVSGIFNPLVLASGVVWPVESINVYLVAIVKYLPLMLPTMALRNIVKKGLTLFDAEIIHGFGILGMWIIITVILSIYVVKRKR